MGCSYVCRGERLGLVSLPDSHVRLSTITSSLDRDKEEKKFRNPLGFTMLQPIDLGNTSCTSKLVGFLF